MSGRSSRRMFWKRRANSVDVCHEGEESEEVKVCRTRATARRTVAMGWRTKANMRVILA
jgi:hypothetical protein